MAITRTPMIDDDGSGTTGTIINNAWKQEFYNQIDASVAGPWVDVPYDAAMYSASAGAWTVSAANQVTFRYQRTGPVMLMMLSIENTALTANASDLRITLPGSVPMPTAMIIVPMTYYAAAGGISGTGTISANVASPLLRFGRDSAGTPFPAGAIYIRGELFYSWA